MGLTFSKSSTNTTEGAGAENETTFQQFANSIRRSFRVKRTTADDASRSSLRSRPSADGVATASARVRPGIPDRFHQQTAASESSATASKATVEHPAKPPTTPAETKPATPKTPEVAPAIASVAMAPQNAAFVAQSPKEVKKDEERGGEMNKAMDLLKGAIRAEDEQGEKKDDKKVEEKEDEGKQSLHHVGDILAQLAPADTSDDKSPETDTAAKPAVSLMAALEKRKAMKEKEKEEESEKSEESEESGESEEENKLKKEGALTHEVTNVLESIAVHSSSIRSKEAATLMAAFAVPPQPSSEVKEEEQKEKEDKKDKEEKKEEEEKEEKEEREHQKEREGKTEEEDEKKEHQEEKEHGKEKEDEKYEKWEEEEHEKLAGYMEWIGGTKAYPELCICLFYVLLAFAYNIYIIYVFNLLNSFHSLST